MHLLPYAVKSELAPDPPKASALIRTRMGFQTQKALSSEWGTKGAGL